MLLAMTRNGSLRAEGVAILVEGVLSGIASSLMLLAMTEEDFPLSLKGEGVRLVNDP